MLFSWSSHVVILVVPLAQLFCIRLFLFVRLEIVRDIDVYIPQEVALEVLPKLRFEFLRNLPCS